MQSILKLLFFMMVIVSCKAETQKVALESAKPISEEETKVTTDKELIQIEGRSETSKTESPDTNTNAESDPVRTDKKETFADKNKETTTSSTDIKQVVTETGRVETEIAKPLDNIEQVEEKVVEAVDAPVKTETESQIEKTTQGISDEKAEIPAQEVLTEQALSKYPDHLPFDKLLKRYVNGRGAVDYKGIKADIDALDAYLKSLSAKVPDNSWKRGEALAYWINAYNGYTLKLIADNYPLNSITDLHGGKPWDHRWIVLGNERYTLNQIENEIIRPKFKEPRIHFAVNCAAASCPPIANTAFTSENLNSLLEKRTNAFINDKQFNLIDENKIQISKIFEWYAEDFGEIIHYLNKYSSTKISDKAKVSYAEYNWALNER